MKLQEAKEVSIIAGQAYYQNKNYLIVLIDGENVKYIQLSDVKILPDNIPGVINIHRPIESVKHKITTKWVNNPIRKKGVAKIIQFKELLKELCMIGMTKAQRHDMLVGDIGDKIIKQCHTAIGEDEILKMYQSLGCNYNKSKLFNQVATYCLLHYPKNTFRILNDGIVGKILNITYIK